LRRESVRLLLAIESDRVGGVNAFINRVGEDRICAIAKPM